MEKLLDYLYLKERLIRAPIFDILTAEYLGKNGTMCVFSCYIPRESRCSRSGRGQMHIYLCRKHLLRIFDPDLFR